MKTSAAECFLAAGLISAVSCKAHTHDLPLDRRSTRLLQEDTVPAAGVTFVEPASSTVSTAGAIENNVIEALEQDGQVTVVDEVHLGELLCENFESAENAPMLQFEITSDETVIVEKSSYSEVSGAAFADGVGRKVWAGVVVDPSKAADEAVPRTVSMTWGDVCDVETFLLKVVTRHTDGTTTVVKSVPCNAGSSTDVCIVEIAVDFHESAEPFSGTASGGSGRSSTTTVFSNGSSSRRLLRQADRRTPQHEPATTLFVPRGGRRKLQSITEIDVMFLYSPVFVELGGMTVSQIESGLSAALATTNEAMSNSAIDLQFNIVHVEEVPDDIDDSDTYDALKNLAENDEVAKLRDAYGADLVQLIGYYENACGTGYYNDGGSDDGVGFSVVKSSCLDNFSHTHEFGHNLGCDHDRDNANNPSEYAHAHRYCDGTDRYRTVMGTDESCDVSRVNYFSNPDVSFEDKATGTSEEDNARAIRDNMVSVSEFRTRYTSADDALEPASSSTTSSTPALYSEDLVDASERTSVSVSANAYDDKVSDNYGCDPEGCTPELTRDSDLDLYSRWSCRYAIKHERCQLWYSLEEAQDIKELQMAFYKGDERTRSFTVTTFNNRESQSEITYHFTSSGETLGYEKFELDSDETYELYITPDDPNEEDWIGITEVKIMVV